MSSTTDLDTTDSAGSKLINAFERIAGIASGVKRKLSYVVLFGLVASAYLAWSLYSSESALWWNVVKCTAVAIPGIVWVFVWTVLGQLEEAPTLVASLAKDQDGVFANLSELSLKEENGLRGIFSSLREFRKEDGLSVVFDTIGGVTLLANPLFAILAFVSLLMLFGLIITALLVLIF